MNPSPWKCCLAEAIGTFGFTVVGAGAVCANRYAGGELGLVGVAVAHGTALAAMVCAVAGVSGGHLNPAVTLAATINGYIGPRRAALFVLSQLGGAAVAGGVLAALYTPAVWEGVALGTPQLSPEVAFSTGVFIEALLTFVLVFTALQVAFDPGAPDIVYGLAIGAVLVAAILVGGPLTGAALNPARAFGPAVASGAWSDQAVYWLGPTAGALAAALASRTLRPSEAG